MNGDNCEKMKMVAKLEVRQFFDHYLQEVFPVQLTAAITAHNQDVTAHAPQIKGAVETATVRLKLWVYGLMFGGGCGVGAGITAVVSALSKN